MAEELEESIRSLLLTFTPVTAIAGAGASARIRPDRFAQGEAWPAVAIEVDAEEQQNDVDGLGGLVIAEVNLVIRAETKAAARALARAVRTNGTDPGTGLAGYSGAAGDQTIHAVLLSETTGFTPLRDGSDQGFYEVNQLYQIVFNEDV